MICSRRIVGAGVLLALLALPQAASAYALKTTERGALVRWNAQRVPLRIDPSAAAVLDGGELRRALTHAAEAWRGLPGVPDLEVEAGAPPPAGHEPRSGPTNGVYVPDPWPFDPTRLAVTLATYDAHTGEMLDADILLNPEQPFALLDERDDARADHYDLAAVLTHELGHVLGLEESDVERSTMWPRVRRSAVDQRTLEVDDEHGVIAVYQDAFLAARRSPSWAGAHVAGTVARRGAPVGVVGIAVLMLWLRRRSSYHA
ncbi:MAG: matrixin family metalloprotease [Myxococcota bacterium]